MLQHTKRLLKRSRTLQRLNAGVRNLQLEWRSRQVDAEYRPRLRHAGPFVGSQVSALLAARMESGRTRPLSGLQRRPRIFLVGTYYEQESAGFIQALEHAGDVVQLRTSAGRYGLKPPTGAEDAATIAENSRQIVEQVTAARASQPIDVLIGTMVAQSVSADALQHIRTLGIPVLNIAMDDRLAEHWGWSGSRRLGAIGLAAASDLVLHTTREYVPRYLVDGHPAVYWPFGSDPRLFEPSCHKRFDVSFVGNNYGWRGTLIEEIARAGINVECFGSGFPNGHVGAERVRQVFAESKVVLGVGTVAHSRRVVTLKLRDFDGPMSGSFYMTTDNADLHDLFRVGEEIQVYRSSKECIHLLQHYLAHDSEREKIAAAGRRRAARDHTWDQRISQAFGLIGWSAGLRSEGTSG